MDRHHQQASIAAMHHSHSLPGEPKTGIISRLELEQCTTATHKLDSQGQTSSAGENCSKKLQSLTFWTTKNRYCQQAKIVLRHHSHSPTRKPKMGIISWPELQQCTTATHSLESQGQASSVGYNLSKAQWLLTNWRAKDRNHQQARIVARYNNHSHPKGPRTDSISRLELQQCTTATHMLESQGQVLSIGYNCYKVPQPLTNWRAKNRNHQQARITARHYNHSQA